MGIKYLQDDDLEFFQYCSEDDLRMLARYLTFDKDGCKRIASELIENKEFQRYAGNPDQHQRCWQLIAGELQHFGGDTFVNIFRGNGVGYKEILCDVCDKLEINFDKKSSANEIENRMLEKFISQSWENMSDEQKAELLKNTGIDETRLGLGKISGATGLSALQAALKLGGIASYRISTLIAGTAASSFTGMVMPLVGGRIFASIFLGPVGLAISTALMMPAISGIAYRVTIPCVIQISYMRRAYANKDHF